ncbi:MAG: hypothetical protein M0P33_09970, partial [Massilibacteroides sp.]|nr:hypothetical protein [Massilibacteroides sp.]
NGQNANLEGGSKQDCGTKALYGLLIALTGLIASFLIAWIMLWFGMRTASDIVAVIGAFTSVTGTLTGYFFGQKIESASRENTENRLSASMSDLSLEKTKNTEITEKLHAAKNENNLRSVCARDNDKLIEIAMGKILQWDKLREDSAASNKVIEVPPENLLNEIRDLLNLAKSTEDVVKSLKIKDD